MSFFKKNTPVVKPPKSVASITAGLSDTLADLEAHAEDQVAKAAFQRSMAERALLAADEHQAESELATTVAGNVKALLGV